MDAKNFRRCYLALCFAIALAVSSACAQTEMVSEPPALPTDSTMPFDSRINKSTQFQSVIPAPPAPPSSSMSALAGLVSTQTVQPVVPSVIRNVRPVDQNVQLVPNVVPLPAPSAVPAPAPVAAGPAILEPAMAAPITRPPLAGPCCNANGFGFAPATPFAGPIAGGWGAGGVALTTDTPYTFQMLDFQNRQGDKETILLNRAAQAGVFPRIVVGAQFRASGLFARTNTANQFSYLGRFPPDFVGTRATDFRLLQANQNLTLNVNRSVHAYFETLFSDVFTFPTFEQGSFQVRQAYVVFGDFTRSPLYGFIGKKNISFGDFSTLSPFTQAVPWHYFAPIAEGAGLGYDNGIFNATITALNGGRGIRVVDSEEIGKLNNFAANMRVRQQLGANSFAQFGAGYLHGTIYDADEAEHINSDLFGELNAAWDVNGTVKLGNLWLAGEYVQTVDPWPVTDFEVIAYRAEAALDTLVAGNPGRFSLSWSEGIQGADGTEFEFNRQLVVGYQFRPQFNTLFTFEYVYGNGFAPLINITRVSNRDAEQHSIVLGAVIAL